MYTSQNIIRAIKSRRMIWAGHIARMWEGERYIQDYGGES
jgi:predicted metal-dependent hydrolase